MPNLQIDIDDEDEKLLTTPRVGDNHIILKHQEEDLVTPRVQDHKSISKSEYIPSKTVSLINPNDQF